MSYETSYCEYPGCDQQHLDPANKAFNVPLARKIWEQINMYPETWLQSVWGLEAVRTISKNEEGETTEKVELANSCHTACCIAGHAAMMTGHQFHRDTTSFEYLESGIKTLFAEELGTTDMAVYDLTYVELENGDFLGTEQIAQHELGLTDYQASKLFYGGNDRDRVQMLLTQFAAEVDDTL